MNLNTDLRMYKIQRTFLTRPEGLAAATSDPRINEQVSGASAISYKMTGTYHCLVPRDQFLQMFAGGLHLLDHLDGRCRLVRIGRVVLGHRFDTHDTLADVAHAARLFLAADGDLAHHF